MKEENFEKKEIKKRYNFKSYGSAYYDGYFYY